jgi:hypothetical protein
MKNVDSVLQFADSAIIGRINYEMRKVLENISNPNTDEKTRKLTIEMDFTPINSRREISTKMTVKTKLRPTDTVKEIERIVKENLVQQIQVGDRTFVTNDRLTEVKPYKPTAARLTFSDLSSIVQIAKREKGRFNLPLYVNIENETRVSVITSMDNEKEREIPYAAETTGSKFRFGCSYDYESFVIAIRSLFEQNDDAKDLLQLLKKFASVESVEMNDDGVSQSVVAKSGATLAENIKAAPIRKLVPYRTFIEAMQPESEFLFRVSPDRTFSLYEADGGAWKIRAKSYIRYFLEGQLREEIESGEVVILG